MPPVTPIGSLYGVSIVAGGGEVITNVVVAGLMTRVTGPVVVSAGVLESVAFTVNVVLPDTAVVPEMVQLEIVRPVGNVPAVIRQV